MNFYNKDIAPPTTAPFANPRQREVIQSSNFGVARDFVPPESMIMAASTSDKAVKQISESVISLPSDTLMGDEPLTQSVQTMLKPMWVNPDSASLPQIREKQVIKK